MVMSKTPFINVSAFPPEMASNLLRNLLRRGCAVASEIYGDEICFYCGNDPDGHAGNCPYWEAIALYGDPNSIADSGVMNK